MALRCALANGGEDLRRRGIGEQVATAELAGLEGELLKLGHRVSASTIRWALKGLKIPRHRNGAPTRPGGSSCTLTRAVAWRP